jgi:hypothetical protein
VNACSGAPLLVVPLSPLTLFLLVAPLKLTMRPSPIHHLKPRWTSYSADVTCHLAKACSAPKFLTAVLVGQSCSYPHFSFSMPVSFPSRDSSLDFTVSYHMMLVRRHWQPTSTLQRAHIGRCSRLVTIYIHTASSHWASIQVI